MTNHDRTDPSPEAAEAAPVSPDATKGALFRQDAGPGSVKRERQPGFGGMDARRAEEGEEHWQNLTSDRYGHVIGPDPEDSDPEETVNNG